MRFAFTDDQRLLAEGVRRFLDRECTPATVRDVRDDPAAGEGLWRGLAELGVVGLTVPAEHGGMGLTLVDLVLLLEEAGAAALPLPLGDVTAVAVPQLIAAGDDELLPAVAAGDTAVVVDLPGAELEAADVVLDPGPGAADRAALAAAAQLVGIGRRVIDLATAHATQRTQFGVPIGSFQAVKHHLASALVEVEFARPVVYRAAWSLTHGTAEASRDASMAKAMAGAAAVLACRASLQVHGAIGYTWEHDLHLWLDAAWRLAGAYGTTDDHRTRVAAAVLGS